MSDILESLEYLKKMQNIITKQYSFMIFNKIIIKKILIDDVLCCFIATLPDSFKSALKRRITNINDLQSISAFNRLSKLIKIPFFLSKDYYFIPYGEVTTLIKTITKNLEKDIRSLEQ